MTLSELKAWRFHPDLTASRLRTIAKFILPVREGSLSLHDEAAGEGPWSLAARRYERTLKVLPTIAKQHSAWLRVEIDGLECLIFIGAAPPMKFAWDDAARPRVGRGRISPRESQGRQGTFFEIDEGFASIPITSPALRLFFTERGEQVVVSLALCDEHGTLGEPWMVQEISIAAAARLIISTPKERLEGIPLPSLDIRFDNDAAPRETVAD